MTSQVYIIILNYKQWQDAIECLTSVFRSRYKEFKVIVIDNCSENASVERLQESIIAEPDPIKSSVFDETAFRDLHTRELTKITFVQNKKNHGFAAGINPVLYKLSREDAYIWLLNPDLTIAEGCLPALLDFANGNDRRAIIGTVVKYYAEPGKVHFVGGGKINFNSGTVDMITDEADINRLDYISGGSLFTHASNFDTIGLLPEQYFLYWEETDWCFQARSKNHPLLVCIDAICYDKISTTIGKSFLADYYYTRNGLIFLSRYDRKKLSTAIVFTILRILKRLFSGQPQRAKGVYTGMMSFLKKRTHAYQ